MRKSMCSRRKTLVKASFCCPLSLPHVHVSNTITSACILTHAYPFTVTLHLTDFLRFLSLMPAGSATLSEEELVAGEIFVVALEHTEGLAVNKLHKLITCGGKAQSAAASFNPNASVAGSQAEDLFAYTKESSSSFGGRLGSLNGQGGPKLGALSATTQEVAAKHLEFFFDELYGKNLVVAC